MDSVDRRLLLGAAGLAGLAALSHRAKGGPLEPPPGSPIEPTGKTIQQVYDKIARDDAGTPESRRPVQGQPPSATALYVITEPGAYYLTGNITQVPGQAAIEVQCDNVDIDGGGHSFIGTPGSPPSSCIRAIGILGLEVYDMGFKGWQGCCVDAGDCDDVYISDCLFHQCACPSNPATGESGAVIRGRDRCDFEDICVSQCDGCTIQARHGSVVFDFTISDSTGDPCRIGDHGCVSDATIRNIAAVLNGNVVVGDACLVEEVDVRDSDGVAILAGAHCVLECNEITGGTGDAFQCGDGTSIDDNLVAGRAGRFVGHWQNAVLRCSITENKGVDCHGFELGAECVCCDNEIAISGGGGGGGAAITVMGERCCVSGNETSGGILVLVGGDGTLIEDNHVRGIPGSPPGTGGGFIGIAQGVTACHVRDNHVHRASTTNAYVIPTGNLYAPIVDGLEGGDLSTKPGGLHPHPNVVTL